MTMATKVVPSVPERPGAREPRLAYHRCMGFDRITAEPGMIEGRPCIRGLRISVESVVRLVAAGWTFEEILENYPDLEREDITQALEYAAAATDVHVIALREPA
jgi:uncharacterized protein (DUF433 family)